MYFFSDSTVTGTDTNILLILGLEPGDSKNYTCIPTTDAVGGTKNGTSYKHYVVGNNNIFLYNNISLILCDVDNNGDDNY